MKFTKIENHAGNLLKYGFPPPSSGGDILGGGDILEGDSSYIQNSKSCCVRQQVLVRAYESDCQGHVERFRESFPLAVSLKLSYSTFGGRHFCGICHFQNGPVFDTVGTARGKKVLSLTEDTCSCCLTLRSQDSV